MQHGFERPWRGTRGPLLSGPLLLLLAVAFALPARPGAGDPAQALSEAGQAALHSLIDGGSHPDLEWRDFRDLREEVRRFYEGGGLAWSDASGPTAQARAVAEILRGAAGKGLEPGDYDGPRWQERMATLSGRTPPPTDLERVRFDVALTVSLLRYLSGLRFGRVEPRLVRFELGREQGGRELSDLLRLRIVKAEDVASEVTSVEPPFAGYWRTLRALEVYSGLARLDDGELLPVPRRPIGPGEPYSGLPRLRRLLRLVGDLAPGADVHTGETVYDVALAEAVARFQRRHGLAPDGLLGAATVEELNRPLSRRVAQLSLTLERWRWLPRRFASPPIVVNIPDFRLLAGDVGRRWSMKVVVGRAYRHQTPVFASEMKYVVFRPYWNVPPGIQRAEIVPRLARDPGFLARGGYEVVDRRWQAPVAGDGSLDRLRTGELRLRQQPGPRNALGLVKFVFPNAHDVYLHDTPSQELFLQPRRDFSHGCIRVEDPVRLAAWVLRERPEWIPERIRAAMDGRETVQVNLPHPVPVLILYGTAVVEEDGEVRFLDDIYGHDAALERALAARRPYADAD